MSYSPFLASSFSDTKLRGSHVSPFSGMCSFCTADCVGTCEIGLSGVLGAEMVYPTNTGSNQVASEKDLPIDYSHFNINGRVFGAVGAPADSDKATLFNIGLERTYGTRHPIKMALPFTFPALIKLNYKDYFGAAAMAGIPCVIGEDARNNDPEAAYDEAGRIIRFPKLDGILDSFRRYDRGYGEIILQCNVEDDMVGLPEYAITKCGVKAIEFKFGQSAKGTQPASPIKTLEAALKKQAGGMIVHPDPSDPAVQEAYAKGAAPAFWSYARLPMWTEESLSARIEELRALGLERVYFKMAGYDRVDMERVLRIAIAVEADMVTYDGAGGGSGRSPSKMMNEWGLPAVCIESALVTICKRLEAEGHTVPAITLTGGFASEDQAYKALAIGAPYITAIGLCRAGMAAAMSGEMIGRLLEEGNLPQHLKKYGTDKESLFRHLTELRSLYGKEADSISTGAISAYSYLQKMAFGLRHFAALNRKFDIRYVDSSDVIPLTRDAKEILRGTWFDY